MFYCFIKSLSIFIAETIYKDISLSNEEKPVLSNSWIFSIYVTPRQYFQSYVLSQKHRLIFVSQIKMVIRVVVSSFLFFLLIFTCKWQKNIFGVIL